MDYPGRIIKAGETNASIVKALKERLNLVLVIGDNPELRLDPTNLTFGPKMKQVIKLFQARNVDNKGHPLKQDGEIGSLTWEALFGADSVPGSSLPGDQLLARVLVIAAGEETKQVREVPRNSNRGPQVDAYLTRAGSAPVYPGVVPSYIGVSMKRQRRWASPIPWSRPSAVSITGTKRRGKAQNASSRRKPYATHKWCTLE
jgi:hypothetical protein